jgi:hypothetical protein
MRPVSGKIWQPLHGFSWIDLPPALLACADEVMNKLPEFAAPAHGSLWHHTVMLNSGDKVR